jgi:hypothetical protein
MCERQQVTPEPKPSSAGSARITQQARQIT